MKKILFLILFISILIFPDGVRGFDFGYWYFENIPVRVEGEEIYDIRTSVFEDRLDVHADNIFYRMKPYTDVPSSTECKVYEGDLQEYDKLSEEQKREIEMITFFGYNYSRRTEVKWYTITQVLIWKVIYGNDNVYFIDKIGGEKIDRYDSEINDLYATIAEFKENNLKFKQEEYEVYNSDTLVLENIDDYEVYKSDYKLTRENNTLKIDNIHDDGKIYLGKMDNYYKYKISIFSYADGNELIRKGNFYYDVKEMVVKVKKGKINFNIDVIKDAYSIDDNIDNTCYILYKEDKERDKICFNGDVRSYSFDNLEIGSYYLKPISMGDGYYSGEEKVIEITKDKLVENVTIEVPLIKNKIELYIKYLDNELLEMEESSFEVYDRNDNLVGILKTDKYGYGEMELGYGKYRLVQIKGKDGYENIQDTIVDIQDNVRSYKLELTSKIDKDNEYVIPNTGMELSSKINFKMIMGLIGGITYFFIKRYR